MIGVHTFSGACWVIPTELVHYRKQKSLGARSIEIYKEKWKIFSEPPFGLTLEQIRKGFRHLNERELQSLALSIGITRPKTLEYRFGPRSPKIMLSSKKEWYIVEIWREIFEAL
ncbi:MAG: hypothetical protein EB045_05100 [Actinobacteria bacterium]|nr:hypothetical protein [Actinomycetota bacterium]